MDNKELYLLQDTQESTQMISGIRQMLDSEDAANRQLALHILKGSGVPDCLLTSLYLIGLWDTDFEMRMQVRELLHQFAPPLQKSLDNRDYADPAGLSNEGVSELLTAISKEVYLDLGQLGNSTLQRYGKGTRFCLDYQTAPAADILRESLFGDAMYLDFAGLKYLPEEIGLFTELFSLNITGNYFTELPDSLAQLGKLKYLNYAATPLSKPCRQKLKTMLPKVFAQISLNKASEAYYDRRYKHSLRHLDKALEICPDCADAWYWKAEVFRMGYNRDEEALPFLRRCLQLEPERISAWINLVSSLYMAGHYGETMDTCQQVFEKFYQPDMDAYLEADLWLVKGLACLGGNQFEEALAANEKSIQLVNHSVAWYNKACVYARQGNKEQMLACLEQSLNMDPYWARYSRRDPDLKQYQRDKDYRALTGRYIKAQNK